ncbi:MAG: glycerophosphodiester phosphodiesterase [Tannerellaceae bacterium]|jgi:glycerophosphoryl diester phosphodiesterase|nr:glycerophosphodiester phosphodiesterase [Tannerellaceae bacterium]
MKQLVFWVVLLAWLIPCQSRAQNKTQVIAHRGYWQTEGSAHNSIKALQLANDINVYGSEFDVHLTADNIPVIFHDDKILDIPVQASNYSDIMDLKLTNGEKIPTLEKYLNKGKIYNCQLIFELKPHATPERNRKAAQVCVKMVTDLGLQDKTEYITFDLDAGKELIRLAPGAQVSYLNGDLSPAQLKEMGFTGLDYNHSVMKEHPEWFDEAKKMGLSINVWTVNDPALIKELARKGADFITTDIPVEAQGILSQCTEQ